MFSSEFHVRDACRATPLRRDVAGLKPGATPLRRGSCLSGNLYNSTGKGRQASFGGVEPPHSKRAAAAFTSAQDCGINGTRATG